MSLPNAVVVLQYKKLEYLPPVMSLLQVLKAGNRNVIYLGVCSVAGRKFLEDLGIEAYLLPSHDNLYKNDSIVTKFTHRVARAVAFPGRRSWVVKRLKSLKTKYGALTLWFSEIQSAALVGNALFEYPRRIVSIFELADFRGKGWCGFDFNRFVHTSHVVVPESNRAAILKEFFNLSQCPGVLPNKPYGHPRGKIPLPDRPDIKKVVREIGNRPVFLYQGVWTRDRADVAKVLETIAQNRPQYCVLTMPECPAVEQLKRKYQNVFSIPYVPPPGHLAVTSCATVGIAIYNASGSALLERLNAIYCAPNKIYEYAGFGIPTLGNDIPGLQCTIGVSQAGKCCKIDKNEILAAADELIANLGFYREKSTEFFDSIDLEAQVQKILREVEV